MSDIEIVKEGRWLYANEVWCVVRIHRVDFWPGTGDHEDAPEIADDRVGEFYRVEYGTPNDGGRFNGGGFHETLSQAIAMVEKIVPTVKWAR
jgi:hypothetical protein